MLVHVMGRPYDLELGNCPSEAGRVWGAIVRAVEMIRPSSQ